MDDVEPEAAELDDVLVLEGDVGEGRLSALDPIAEELPECGELFLGAGALVLDGRARRDDGGALRLLIAVAEPAMVLAAGVDDVAHRRVGDLADSIVDRRSALPGPAGIDEQHAINGHDDAEGRIIGKILRAALGLFPDERPDPIGDRLDVEARGAFRDDQRCDDDERAADQFRYSSG
jgi:hypothetical protein